MDIIILTSTLLGLSLWMLTVSFSSPSRRRTALWNGPSPETGCPSKWSRAGPGSHFHSNWGWTEEPAHLLVWAVWFSFFSECLLVAVKRFWLWYWTNAWSSSSLHSFPFKKKKNCMKLHFPQTNRKRIIKKVRNGMNASYNCTQICSFHNYPHSLRWNYCHLITSLKKSIHWLVLPV